MPTNLGETPQHTVGRSLLVPVLPFLSRSFGGFAMGNLSSGGRLLLLGGSGFVLRRNIKPVSRGETIPSFVDHLKRGCSETFEGSLLTEGKSCRGFWKDFTTKPRGCLAPSNGSRPSSVWYFKCFEHTSGSEGFTVYTRVKRGGDGFHLAYLGFFPFITYRG